jgi:hypothetical protein
MTRTEERRLVAALRRGARKYRDMADQWDVDSSARSALLRAAFVLRWEAVFIVQRVAKKGHKS